MRRLFLAAALVLATTAAAFSQTVFPTPQPGVVAPGTVAMCPTPNGQYVPCGAAGSLPRPVTVTAPVNVLQPAVAVTANASGSTGAVTATLATVPGKTLFICGFDVSAIGGTAAIGPITVTGLLGGTFTYQQSSSAAGIVLSRTFTPCIPANGQNQSIAVVTTADGTATAVNVNITGVAQ
jgi:hypothetical protein